MRIIVPPMPANFAWSADATPPAIPLTTDVQGPHKWSWTLKWMGKAKQFSASGTAMTPMNKWNGSEAAVQGGGTLTVSAQCGPQSAPPVTIKITGLNPSLAQVLQFLGTQPNSDGFDKILSQESHGRNFTPHGDPIESFDHGFGMCQLTKPAPSFDQIWNWKSNVQAGLALFGEKRKAAIAYLGQGARTYTNDQLLHETVSQWNGGHYYVLVKNAWVRNPNVLCDSKTGNIGWDMTDPDNAGKSEADLRKRDSASYNKHTDDSDWGYFGVCYADHLLGPG